jgi:hypothetical protein
VRLVVGLAAKYLQKHLAPYGEARSLRKRILADNRSEMPPNPFDSPHIKIARAQDHVEDLRIKVREFKSKRPYEIIIEPDTKPGYKIHKLRLTEAVPRRAISPIVGDIVNNLRAALDHAVYACALANGHASPRYGTCTFPFRKTRAELDNAVNGCTSVPDEIRTCLRAFRAYDGGYEVLWELNQMCNRDKHALISPVVCGYSSISVRTDSGRVESPANPHWNSAKDEVELFRTNGDPKYDLAATLDIALGGPGILAGYPAVPMLNSLVTVVFSVVTTIEAEARRIRLVN